MAQTKLTFITLFVLSSCTMFKHDVCSHEIVDAWPKSFKLKAMASSHEDKILLGSDTYLVFHESILRGKSAAASDQSNEELDQYYLSVCSRDHHLPHKFPIWDTFVTNSLATDLALQDKSANLLTGAIFGDDRIVYVMNFLGSCIVAVARRTNGTGWNTMPQEVQSNPFQQANGESLGMIARTASLEVDVKSHTIVIDLRNDGGSTRQYRLLLDNQKWSVKRDEVLSNVVDDR